MSGANLTVNNYKTDDALLKSKNDAIVKLCNAFGTKTEIIQSKENHQFGESVCNYFILSGITQENMEAYTNYFSIIDTNPEYSAFKTTNLIVLENNNRATCGCEQPPTRGVVQSDGTTVLWEQVIFACYPSVDNFNNFGAIFGTLYLSYYQNFYDNSPQENFDNASTILDKITVVEDYIKSQPDWDKPAGPFLGYPGTFMDIVFIATYAIQFMTWSCLVNVAESNGAYTNNCTNTWYNFDLSVTEIAKEGVSYDSTASYTYNQNEWLASSFMANKSGSKQGTSCGNSHATTPDPINNPLGYTVNKKYITTVNVSFGAQGDSSSAPTKQINYLNNPVKKFFGKYKCNTATVVYQQVVAAGTDPSTSSLIDTIPLLPDFKLGDNGDTLYPNSENYLAANYIPTILDINKSVYTNPLKAFSLSTADFLQPVQGILNSNGITEDLYFAKGLTTIVIKSGDNTIINPVFSETFNIFNIIQGTAGELYIFTENNNAITILEKYSYMTESLREVICWRLSPDHSVLDAIKSFYGVILLEDSDFYAKLFKDIINWQQTGQLVEKWSFGGVFSFSASYSDMYKLAEAVNLTTVNSTYNDLYNNAITTKNNNSGTFLLAANVSKVTEADFNTLLANFS